MEGPVKERLTGALILVAALVIIVPEMLSGPDPDPAGSVATPVQQVDAAPPLRTYSMVLNESGEAHAAMQAPAPAPATSATPAPPLETPRPAPAAAQPAPIAAAVAQVTTVEPSRAVKTAAPVPEQRESNVPPAAGRWWAQLGSFSARDNADRLTRQLRAAGFAIDMSKVSAAGKELYRVRAGPVRSRVEAQELQSRLAAAGHESAIVPP